MDAGSEAEVRVWVRIVEGRNRSTGMMQLEQELPEGTEGRKPGAFYFNPKLLIKLGLPPLPPVHNGSGSGHPFRLNQTFEQFRQSGDGAV